MGDPVLVTGGGGFLGRHLVAELLAQGEAVRVLDPRPLDPAPRLTAIPGSILDPVTLARAMRGCGTVYHLAAVAQLFAPDPAIYQRVNVEGTRAVLDAARAGAVETIVVVSSAVILRGWADPDSTPISETCPRPPLDGMPGPYSRSKHTADTLVREAAALGLPAVTLYPTVPIGAGDIGMTPPTRMLAMLLDRPPPAYLSTLLDLVPVIDLARLCRLAAARAAPGSRYVAAGEPWALATLLDWLGARTGRPMPRRRIPYGVAALTSHIAEPLARLRGNKAPAASIEAVRLARYPRRDDARLAARELDWQAGAIEPALEATLAWLGRPVPR